MPNFMIETVHSDKVIKSIEETIDYANTFLEADLDWQALTKSAIEDLHATIKRLEAIKAMSVQEGVLCFVIPENHDKAALKKLITLATEIIIATSDENEKFFAAKIIEQAIASQNHMTADDKAAEIIIPMLPAEKIYAIGLLERVEFASHNANAGKILNQLESLQKVKDRFKDDNNLTSIEKGILQHCYDRLTKHGINTLIKLMDPDKEAPETMINHAAEILKTLEHAVAASKSILSTSWFFGILNRIFQALGMKPYFLHNSRHAIRKINTINVELVGIENPSDIKGRLAEIKNEDPSLPNKPHRRSGSYKKL